LVKLDKVLVRSGLADSASDGQRKIKQGAVRIDNEVKKEVVLSLKAPATFMLRVGRQIKRIQLA
jgi:tyrosyl-tRNA synthetase